MPAVPRTDFGGVFKVTVSALDLANHTAVASVDTTVTCTDVRTNDYGWAVIARVAG